MKHYIGPLIILLLSLHQGTYGQSYHFSQFFSTPLLTNPANTGVYDGVYRLASNFRAQGVSGGSPYLTGYISADMSPFKEKLLPGHKAGVGLYVMNDQSVNGGLKDNSVGLSAAYNIGLDEDEIYSLGIGFQATYHQRTLDYSKLRFDSQFEGDGFNASLPIGESFDYLKRNYFDVNAGLLYRVEGEKGSVFGGAAAYNLLRHKDNTLGEAYQMPTRYVLQAGSRFHSGTNGSVYMSLTYMQQAKASEATFGAAYGLQLTEGEENEVKFGAWYRLKDAIIPYIGYQKSGFQIGFTYDYTTSSRKTGSQVKNGYELTLIYTAPDLSELKKAIPWY
jgi:type IX secretion system PorP/SprF family membrane protein